MKEVKHLMKINYFTSLLGVGKVQLNNLILNPIFIIKIG